MSAVPWAVLCLFVFCVVAGSLLIHLVDVTEVESVEVLYVTARSVVMSFSSVGNATIFKVDVALSGSDDFYSYGPDAVFNASQLPITIGGLHENTAYDFRVNSGRPGVFQSTSHTNGCR